MELTAVSELLTQAHKTIDTLNIELAKANKEMSRKFWIGAGVGSGVTAVVFSILYIAVLPNRR